MSREKPRAPYYCNAANARKMINKITRNITGCAQNNKNRVQPPRTTVDNGVTIQLAPYKECCESPGTRAQIIVRRRRPVRAIILNGV